MAKLAMVTLVVPDYDEAIAYFTDVLRFALVEDAKMSQDKRWVVVSPGEGANVLLAKATTPAQVASIGKQTGGRVGFFLHVDDFEKRYEHMRAHDVRFVEAPREEAYGQVVVFEDMYGNRWDMIGPTTQ